MPPVEGYVQPADANTLTGHGTYGSRVFDSFDGTYVAANVCDRCLSAALKEGRAEIVAPLATCCSTLTPGAGGPCF